MPLRDNFLTVLPAIVQALSKRVLSAVVALAAEIGRLLRRTAATIANFLKLAVKKSWHFYCLVELSLIDGFVSAILTLWGMRYVAFIVALFVGLVVLEYWLLAAIYLAVIGLAVWRYYSADTETVAHSIQEQEPLRVWLTWVLRWLIRILMVIVTIVSVANTLGVSPSKLVEILVSKWQAHLTEKQVDNAQPRQSPSKQQGSEVSLGKPSKWLRSTADQSQVTAEDLGLVESQVTAPAQRFEIDVDQIYSENLPSVQEALANANSTVSEEVAAAAMRAARTYDINSDLSKITRDRKTARRLNDEARLRFLATGVDADAEFYQPIVELQRRAFQADPADIEVAGNLAIYLVHAKKSTSALKYAVYALSLPRGEDSTGRTTDWSTIAAAYASMGDQKNARSALFLTLAISTDIKKRCESAVYAAQKAYGKVLRPATEALLFRVKNMHLSDAYECTLPIAW